MDYWQKKAKIDEEYKLSYEYINNVNVVISSKTEFNLISNNLFEYKIKDIVKINTLKFSKNYLDGYIYPINNILKIGDKIEFANNSAKRFHLNSEWSTVENGAVWGYGAESRISFSVAEVADCIPVIEFSFEPMQSKSNVLGNE
mgnify:CR=1 FL=1